MIVVTISALGIATTSSSTNICGVVVIGSGDGRAEQHSRRSVCLLWMRVCERYTHTHTHTHRERERERERDVFLPDFYETNTSPIQVW